MRKQAQPASRARAVKATSAVTVAPPEKESLAEQLFDELRNEILTGKLAPGEVINEPALAARYSVSKTPVREALRLLVHSDWVVTLPRKGYLVKPLGLSDIREIYALRRIIEPQLAAETAQRATEDVVEHLRAVVAQQEARDDNVNHVTSFAKDFHLLIAEYSGNKRAHRVVSALVDDYIRLMYLIPRLAPDDLQSLAQVDAHEQIVEAIAQRDSTKAEQLMREHITEAGRNLTRIFTEVG